MRRIVSVTVLLVMAAIVSGACASMQPSEPSLYKRLGGREGIRGVVDDFVAFLVADPRVSARFKNLKPPEVERLKTNASDQVCAATCGPCSYLGKDMKAAHAGMKIVDAEWTATVEDLVKALDKRGVPKKEQQELLTILGPMKRDIVGQ
jgi:hemoglobin